jgi:hypothetical protein
MMKYNEKNHWQMAMGNGSKKTQTDFQDTPFFSFVIQNSKFVIRNLIYLHPKGRQAAPQITLKA